MAGAEVRFLVTCEHGGNRVPNRYRELFNGQEELLATHRGYDAGALTLARQLAAMLAARLFASTTSRLLVDLNRSVGHSQLYGPAVRRAPASIRRKLLARHYQPFRRRAEAAIAQAAACGERVIHISCHSFTPELDGIVRNADIGLLYDPARSAEAALCRRWQHALATSALPLRVRRNYPYAGDADGFTAYLRRRFAPDQYIGVELEINQKHVVYGRRHWQALRAHVTDALAAALTEFR